MLIMIGRVRKVLKWVRDIFSRRSITSARHPSLISAGGSITSTASSAISSSVRRLRMFALPDRRDDVGGRGLGAVVGPGGHQPAALLEQVGVAQIGSLGPVARELVCKRGLAHVGRVCRALDCPLFERRPHTVHRRLGAYFPENAEHGVVVDRKWSL